MSDWAISNLRTELREHLGKLDITDLPNTDADLLLNRGKWHIEEALELPQNDIHDTFDTVVGQEEYDVNFPFDAIISLAREDATQEILVPIHRISEDDYNANHSFAVASQDAPTNYFKRGEKLILTPIPDAIYTIRFSRRELLDDLSDSVINLSMSKAMKDITFFQAVVLGHMRQRDYNAATRVQTFVDNLIRKYVTSKTKDDGNDHFMQVQIIRNEYNPS